MHGGGGSRGGGFGGGGFRGGGFGGRPGGGFGMRGPVFFMGPGWGWGRRYYGPRGCISGIISSVVMLMLVAVLLFASLFSSPDIEKSTVERTKLDASYVQKESEEWYSDENHIVISNAAREYQLLEAMKYFYETTGVQPYLYVTNQINGNTSPSVADFQRFEKELYAELFGNDGGHLILLYFESKLTGEYTSDVCTGERAATVIDKEAIEILLDYVDYHYNQNDLKYEEVFTNSFRKAADRIMGGKTQFWEDWSVGVWLSIVLAIVVVILIVVSAFRKSNKNGNNGTFGQNGNGQNGYSGGYGSDNNNYSKF